MKALQIKHLSAGYGNARVVRDVSLELEDGASVAIVGKNGAGKSTLLLSMFGGADRQGGSVSVDGRSIEHLPPYAASKHGLSLSPQGRLILAHLSVRENLLLGASARRSGVWNLQEVFKLFPILAERQHSPGTALSGGQQQMLAIGRALMANPRVLVLDEPSEGLSPVMVDEIAAVLNRIRQLGTGILVVEQHLSLVRRVAQRFFVMSKGSFIGHGAISEIDSESNRAAMAF
jgi:ABC-type branched-subunit amino acid transport system ATPase component